MRPSEIPSARRCRGWSRRRRAPPRRCGPPCPRSAWSRSRRAARRRGCSPRASDPRPGCRRCRPRGCSCQRPPRCARARCRSSRPCRRRGPRRASPRNTWARRTARSGSPSRGRGRSSSSAQSGWTRGWSSRAPDPGGSPTRRPSRSSRASSRAAPGTRGRPACWARAPNSLAQPQNILVLVLSSTWTSMPKTGSKRLDCVVVSHLAHFDTSNSGACAIKWPPQLGRQERLERGADAVEARVLVRRGKDLEADGQPVLGRDARREATCQGCPRGSPGWSRRR